MTRTLHKGRGFTLLEMIIVLAIFALLAGIAIPVVGAALRIEDTNTTRERMKDLATGIRNFYQDTGSFPADLDELLSAPKKLPGWCGPYVNRGFATPKDNIFYDAWQNPFQYLKVDLRTRRLRSLGMNASDDGGKGDDIDLDVNIDDLLRIRNLALLAEINTAIAAYNAAYRVTRLPPIPPTGKKIKEDPKGFWHTHTYIYKGNWYSTTHQHDLDLVHSVKDLHPGHEDDVTDEGSVMDVPLKGPWSYTLSLLTLRRLLDNGDGRYSTDVWGNPFVTGPDPVQYVTSQGSN